MCLITNWWLSLRILTLKINFKNIKTKTVILYYLISLGIVEWGFKRKNMKGLKFLLLAVCNSCKGILDHYCNGWRAFDFFRQKFAGFKRWVAGDPNGAVVQANPNDAGNQANPNDAGTQANPNDAGTQANPVSAVIQANQDDVVS